MKLILTSSLGGAVKLNGKRLPCGFPTENKLPDTLRACWKSPSRVILIAASPDFYEKNDDLAACFRQSFPLNGLPISALELCDARNPELAAQICEADVLIFPGGHVPTQNAFYHRLQLRQRLRAFSGLVIAWSAGSMNCAETVYAAPEFPGEALDPNYRRWLPGLGLTALNIFPHFQDLQGELLDGLRVVEDITFADSMGHDLIALNDGSYIFIDETGRRLFGETFRIRDGIVTKLCERGASVQL